MGCGVYITISNSTLTASASSSMAFKIYFMPHCSPREVCTKNIQHCSSISWDYFLTTHILSKYFLCTNYCQYGRGRCCHSIFPFKDCIERKRYILIPRLCFNCLKSNVRMPFLREVITNQQKRKLYPFCVYSIHVLLLQN